MDQINEHSGYDSDYALLAADSTHYGLGFCGWVLTVISWLIVIMTFPLSLCVCMKVSYSSSLQYVGPTGVCKYISVGPLLTQPII